MSSNLQLDFRIMYFSFKHKKLLKLSQTQVGEESDFMRYQDILNNMNIQNEAPKWADPAIKYFQKEVMSSIAMETGKIPKLNLRNVSNNHFLYPLCNSPKRKEYYKDTINHYRTELIKQINQK